MDGEADHRVGVRFLAGRVAFLVVALALGDEPFHLLGKLERRRRGGRCGNSRIRPGRKLNSLRRAPAARLLDARIHGLDQPIGAQVDQIVHRNFGGEDLQLDMPSELPDAAGGLRRVVFLDPMAQTVEVAVRTGLDDLEIVRDEPIVPLALTTDGPDDPDFVGAAPQRLLQVRVGHIDRIDVCAAAEFDRRKPHWERDARAKHVLGDLRGRKNFQFVFAEVVDVEGRIHRRRGDLLKVEAPGWKHMRSIGIEREHRSSERELAWVGKIEADALGWVGLAPIVGHGPAVHALAVHGEIEHAAAGAVDVVEFQAGFIQPHLQYASLEGDLETAACENERSFLLLWSRWHIRNLTIVCWNGDFSHKSTVDAIKPRGCIADALMSPDSINADARVYVRVNVPGSIFEQQASLSSTVERGGRNDTGFVPASSSRSSLRLVLINHSAPAVAASNAAKVWE